MSESNDRSIIPPMLVDLASERVGGQALLASDEFFAEKENLLKPGRGIFIPDKYTDRGKWMDGWESRRKRTPGNDWCIVKLGLSGIVKAIDIDTNHFLGNHPPFASLEGATVDRHVSADTLAEDASLWKEILPKSPLNPGSQNVFHITNPHRWTHVRLSIYPDGGVARLRVYGDVVPDWSKHAPDEEVDLAAVQNGGTVIATSDMFFGNALNMLMPGRAANMGDGWETKRRRGPGHDWAVLKLGHAGIIKKVEVDTHHFKGNYPDQCSIDACNEPGLLNDRIHSITWTPLLPKTKLLADAKHIYETELIRAGECTHLRLNIYPDGGISRFRVWGILK